MRKLIFATAFVATGLFAITKAQLEKGNWMVGGNIIASGFGLNTGGGYNFILEPKAGYFINNNFVFGGQVTFGFLGTKGGPTTYKYSIGPMLRYYLSNTQVNSSLKHGRFLLEGNAGIGGTNITKGGNSTIGISLGFGSGYAYFITPNIAIEGLVKYNGDFGFGNIGTTSNIGFNVGFQIYLPTTKLKDITHDMQQKNIN